MYVCSTSYSEKKPWFDKRIKAFKQQAAVKNACERFHEVLTTADESDDKKISLKELRLAYGKVIYCRNDIHVYQRTYFTMLIKFIFDVFNCSLHCMIIANLTNSFLPDLLRVS